MSADRPALPAPPVLVWTREAPTVPGHFWIRPWWKKPAEPFEADLRLLLVERPRIVYVAKDRPGFLCIAETDPLEGCSCDGYEWSGPIPLPKEAM